MSQYQHLRDFFAGYFPQYWEKFYKWFDGEQPNYQVVIGVFISETSEEHISRIISMLEHLIGQKHSEDELEEIIFFTLHCRFSVRKEGITYQEWLESILEILQNHQNNSD